MSKRSGYQDIDTIQDAAGVVAVISRRESNGQLSVGFFKVFDRDGEQEKTAFLQRKHLDAVERLIPLARDRMDELEDERRQSGRVAAATEGRR
jgi:hypothetical protein